MKYCSKCGAELVDEAVVCPKCGCSAEDKSQVEQAKTTNGFAIAGFVCSFIIPILGWIFGGIGLSKAKKLNNGKALSIAAIIIASVMFVYSLVQLGAVIAVLIEMLGELEGLEGLEGLEYYI